MAADPSTAAFLQVLGAELTHMHGPQQQRRVLQAVRNALVGPHEQQHEVSAGMGIAAQLLGTTRGDRLPSRRGMRASLEAGDEGSPPAPAPAPRMDSRGDGYLLRPGTAPPGTRRQRRHRGSADGPSRRPSSAEGERIRTFAVPFGTADETSAGTSGGGSHGGGGSGGGAGIGAWGVSHPPVQPMHAWGAPAPAPARTSAHEVERAPHDYEEAAESASSDAGSLSDDFLDSLEEATAAAVSI
eukprot:SAG22_NODE_7593_length_726_cov_0.778309_1_plen_241_part_11